MTLTVLKFICFLPLSFLLTLGAWILAPIAPLFRTKDYRLPKPWLWWMMTPHTDLRGDPDHQKKWNGKSEYLQMVTWILRNPACNGQREWLGFTMKTGDVAHLYGDEDIGDNIGKSGTRLTTVTRDGKVKAFHYYVVKQYGHSKKCFRCQFGWKLWAHPTVTGEPCQITGLIQPIKSFG